MIMTHALFSIPLPKNEPVLDYAPGSPERAALQQALDEMLSQKWDIPLIIGGKEIRTASTGRLIQPHDHQNSLGVFHQVTEKEIRLAVEAAMTARKEWEKVPADQRAAMAMKAAELLTTTYRYRMNAATMLVQGKNIYQAEIDCIAEMADFLRFNAYYMTQIYGEQPPYILANGSMNRTDHRPLEGFVFAVTPFNFTAIGGNLPLSPALMGNTVLWKPASTSVLSNYLLMKIFQEAGFPDGVINFIPGSGRLVGDIVLESPDLAGVHFTGSTGVFNHMWSVIGQNIARYKTYPRIVGETGGKDFVVAHPSADARQVATALVRGAFEYQGQKCSAASRAYLPSSLSQPVFDAMGAMLKEISPEPPTTIGAFFNAVIDEKSYDSIMSYIEKAKASKDAKILFGGEGNKERGYFIEPTVILTTDPHFLTMEDEIFGPVLTVFVYDDGDFDHVLALCDSTSPYGLTGAVFARDRSAVAKAEEKLRYAAGNFYINDKPTGAVVGQQPFGGSRASGTNDKAGSKLNLLRWISPRTIKETFNPPKSPAYPFMEKTPAQ
ncbi:MAG TPA: L-glutamate gamma-semialdehyde dehydrogenase [Candidatus Mcinerneyibacteriales bacterium]|nr:L-glutamate gamma-semialdehyde dehydrogenase [Candidatus Mcinerneyibacteriales bacterium]